jgi:hypothetical protein
VKCVIAIDQPASLGVAAREFDRGFDGFGSAVGEEDARKPIRGMARQPFGNQPAQQPRIHPNQVRQVAIHQFLQDRADLGMVAAQGKNAPASQ